MHTCTNAGLQLPHADNSANQLEEWPQLLKKGTRSFKVREIKIRTEPIVEQLVLMLFCLINALAELNYDRLLPCW
jgi:hypothetical protein